LGSAVEQSTTTEPDWLQPFSQPVFATDHRLHLARAGDADEDDRGPFGDLLGRGNLGGTPRHEILDRDAVAMRRYRQRMALLDDVLRHAVAHQAEPDKAGLLFRLRHARSPLVGFKQVSVNLQSFRCSDFCSLTARMQARVVADGATVRWVLCLRGKIDGGGSPFAAHDAFMRACRSCTRHRLYWFRLAFQKDVP
jgi:hypothetical protein